MSIANPNQWPHHREGETLGESWLRHAKELHAYSTWTDAVEARVDRWIETAGYFAAAVYGYCLHDGAWIGLLYGVTAWVIASGIAVSAHLLYMRRIGRKEPNDTPARYFKDGVKP